MSLKTGFETKIDPQQLSDHLVPILRAMGFIPAGHYARITIKGLNGPIPIIIHYEKEEPPRRGLVLLRTNGKKRQKLQEGDGV